MFVALAVDVVLSPGVPNVQHHSPMLARHPHCGTDSSISMGN